MKVPITLTIMYLVFLFTMVYLLSSCSTMKNISKDSYIMVPTDTLDGRPMYSILIKEGRHTKCVMENMYAEEIAYSLKTGVWQYNEDLIVK